MQTPGEKRLAVPLTKLTDGQTGTLVTVDADRHGRWHEPTIGQRGRGRLCEKRLMDLGLTPGTKVTVVGSAPFHGPLEILVRGSRLALGRRIAERILVEIEESG